MSDKSVSEYSVINNSAFRDSRLSLVAKGLMGVLLTRSDGGQLVHDLAEPPVLDELVRCGYLEPAAGDYIVHECPAVLVEQPDKQMPLTRVRSEGYGFEAFWSAYPRKLKKSEARKVWISKGLAGMADVIVADVRHRLAVDVQWREVRYIPHPTTYLRGDRWEDEITPEQEPVDANSVDAIRQRSREAMGLTVSPFKSVLEHKG